MAKRKYQLPHYDRVHPMIRNALNIGVLKSEVEMAFVDREPESVRLFFNNGGCGECFGVGSDMAASIRVHWDSEYETHGDRIGRIYHQVWEDFMDLEMLNPGIALEQEATNFAYAEATAAHEYDRYGRQAFSIMPMMAEMFENTDLGDLTLDDLHMPFDCFYVSLEESKVTFLDGFYVHRRQDVGGDVLAFVGFGFQCDADHVNETWPDDYTPRTEKEAADRTGTFATTLRFNSTELPEASMTSRGHALTCGVGCLWSRSLIESTIIPTSSMDLTRREGSLGWG